MTRIFIGTLVLGLFYLAPSRAIIVGAVRSWARGLARMIMRTTA